MPITTHSFEKPNLANLEALIQSPAVSKQEKQALKSYKEKMDEKTGEVKVDYTVEKYGRFNGYAKKGKFKTYTTGTSMKRVIRNIIFGEEYDDLDIANCSGNVMCQLFQKHNLPTERMSYLNENREDVLQMIMDFHKEKKVERATAKDILIEVFFCGSGYSSQYWEMNPFTNKKETIIRYALPPFVNELKKEYKSNLEAVVEMPEYRDIRDHIVKKAEDKGKEAWIGQFASELYQDEERKVLQVIHEDILTIAKKRTIEHPVGSLIYDGLHTKKQLEIRNYIRRLEQTITDKTDYVLKLEIKDMDVSEEERKTFIGDNKKTPLTYEALKAWFEETHFKTHKGKYPFHTTDTRDGVLSRDKTSFSTAYEDWVEDGNVFLKNWFGDPHKRSYEEIEYACVKEENQKKDVYYAFPTLRYKTLSSTSTDEEKKENIDYFLDYLKCLVEDNEEYMLWMKYWIADVLLNPDDKGSQPISVILFSLQGSGKTSLRVLMEYLLGVKMTHHTEDPTKNGDILHEFNSTLKFKIFIEFEEINMRVHSKCVEAIKQLITNHTHSITHKGQDSIDVKATERLLFTTNKSNSAVIDLGDRRYVAFAMSKRHLGDTAYWNGFYERLRNNNFIKDIADYLCSFKDNIAHYAFRDERPITNYYKSLQQLSIAPELDFLKDLFFYHSDEVQDYLTATEETPDQYTIQSTILHDKYNSWRHIHALEGKVSAKTFTQKMESSVGETYGLSHKKTTNHNVFIIHAKKLKTKLATDFNLTVEQDTPSLLRLSEPRIINPHPHDDEKE